MFEKLLAEKRRITDLKYKKAHAFQDAINFQLQKLWKKEFPQKKYNASKARELEAVKDYYATVKERRTYEKFWEVWRKREDKIEGQLEIEAQNLSVPYGDLILAERISSHGWSTQGYGALKYARDAAQAKLDAAKLFGVEGEICLVDTGSTPDGCAYGTYVVWLQTTELGLEILKRKRISLAERVRQSWARGCQPRVNMPFLPHGYEQSVGLDFFGRIIDQQLFNRANGNI